MTLLILESNQPAHRQEAGSAALLLNLRIPKEEDWVSSASHAAYLRTYSRGRPSSHGSLWRKSLGPMSEIIGHLHRPQAPPLAESRSSMTMSRAECRANFSPAASPVEQQSLGAGNASQAQVSCREARQGTRQPTLDMPTACPDAASGIATKCIINTDRSDISGSTASSVVRAVMPATSVR